LFRNIEVDLGTHGFCIMVLESFALALDQYHIKTKKELLHQCTEIFELIQTIKPRYAILIDSFYKILCQASSEKDSVADIIESIYQIKKNVENEMLDLLKSAEAIEADLKTILIYDHSHTVQNVLGHLRDRGQRFNVLLAEQDLNKTEDNVEFFHHHKIPFKVVPAYMLSHLEESIDMAFFGAVTFQEGNRFVMDPGTKSIISELKLEGKKICLFLTTSKFSLWPVKAKSNQIHVKSDIRSHHIMNKIEFERIKFSHDRIAVDLVDFVVTEKGIFKPDELKSEFKKQMAKREKIDQKIKMNLT